MTTTTRNYETFTASRDDANGTWDVVDADGLVLDSFDTKAEAQAEATRLGDESEAEWLAAEITDRMADASVADLRRFADFVGGIR